MTEPEASQPSAPRAKRRLPFLPVVLILALGSAGLFAFHEKNAQAQGNAKRGDVAVPVAVTTVEKADVDVIEQALGTVTPLAAVTVRTQITGQIIDIAFKEGQMVQKGDFLAQIDDRPYQASLAQYEGALKKDQGLLQQAKADLERYQKLAAQDSIARQKLDAQIAAVQQYEGEVASDTAQIASAKLNIDYCHITAPIAGRVGLRKVDAGNYIQASDTDGLTTLTQLDPISVMFTLPESKVAAVAARLAAGAEMKVEAFDRTQTTKLAEGKVAALDNQIDTTTGTVKMRAQFNNGGNALFPNQFVNVRLTVDTQKDVLTLPNAAILRGAPGTFVYVAKDDGTVAMRVVKLGVSQNDKTVIESGLEAGEKVVIDGTDKLRDGAAYRLPEKRDAKS